MDLNHDKGLQRALCYHYTTGQARPEAIRAEGARQTFSCGQMFSSRSPARPSERTVNRERDVGRPAKDRTGQL